MMNEADMPFAFIDYRYYSWVGIQTSFLKQKQKIILH